MDTYFAGDKLYGDDFDANQIQKWFDEEKEAYADLGSSEKSKYSYSYHNLNKIHGFNYLKNIKTFGNVLGIGAAWGEEFIPIIDKIQNLYILEPSDNMISDKIGNIIPKYYKPNISGKIDFEDNKFDLITCFGTLHHIPNVTYVISEIYRILKPDGFLLIREPIVSMGDWNYKRDGLTKNERGIPVNIFRNTFQKLGFKVVKESFCLSATAFLQRKLSKILKKSLIARKSYIRFDKLISILLTWNVKYHHVKFFNRISPQNIFYVLKK